MKFESLAIPELKLITPKVHRDERGFFLETFRQDLFEANCGSYELVQDNHSRSVKGVLRGLHYQLNQPQGKLIRVTKGRVYDVAVDLRKHSATYGKWEGVYLDDDSMQMLWIPPGFAHGFLVLSDEVEFQYKCSDYYAPGDEHTLLWNDPTLAIDWPLAELESKAPILSEKDKQGLVFSDCPKF